MDLDALGQCFLLTESIRKEKNGIYTNFIYFYSLGHTVTQYIWSKTIIIIAISISESHPNSFIAKSGIMPESHDMIYIKIAFWTLIKMSNRYKRTNCTLTALLFEESTDSMLSLKEIILRKH